MNASIPVVLDKEVEYHKEDLASKMKIKVEKLWSTDYHREILRMLKDLYKNWFSWSTQY
jgi:hypothetical protein